MYSATVATRASRIDGTKFPQAANCRHRASAVSLDRLTPRSASWPATSPADKSVSNVAENMSMIAR